VWAKAHGVHVQDVDGNRFVDLAGGFGVALLGHAHPEIVRALAEQSVSLVHGFGDVHPSLPKVRLLERLAALAPFEANVMLGVHGADAIEAALKTSMLHTRRPGVLAFEGGYHGLSHGPLAVCGYSDAFRAPFAEQLNPHVQFVPWPRRDERPNGALEALEQALRAQRGHVGALVVEPILGRGGVRIPPDGFLSGVRELCSRYGVLVIADEILIGLGRCGAPLWSVQAGLEPDLVCVGKQLGGGMPISACLGRSEVMRAWGDPAGEAIHTATFFGHPLACAAACVSLALLEEATPRVTGEGEAWLAILRSALDAHPAVRDVRGQGLLLGVELDSGARTLGVVARLLEKGWITLPAGAGAEVLQLLPAVGFPASLRDAFVQALVDVLNEVNAS
jgi:4-aminobutyrate aminotransferase-like enzyme